MAEDYYKTLGVTKSAGKDEIKKAYRKLAMKFHPDRNKGDKVAEDRFKQVNEAYAVLSDPEKKQQYDTYGSTDFHKRYSQEDIFRNADLGSIFREFGINFGGVGGQAGGGGGHPFEAFFGGGMGGGGRTTFHTGGFGGQQMRPTKGGDYNLELPISLNDVLTGTEKTISLGRGTSAEKVSVKIPAGIESGKKLRISGKGSPSPDGGPNGDLFLRVTITPHHLFQRDGNDLIIDKPIPFTGAVLGTTVAVPTLDGKQFNVKVPAGVQANGKLRLKGHGLPSGPLGPRGDILVRIVIDIPKEVTPEQQALLEQLAASGL